MKELWSWAMATPQNALVALFVFAFIGNLVTRFYFWVAGPAAWGRLATKWPRVASFLLIFKRAFADAVGVAKAVAGVVTGRLQARAGGGEATPLPSVTPAEAEKVLEQLAKDASGKGA